MRTPGFADRCVPLPRSEGSSSIARSAGTGLASKRPSSTAGARRPSPSPASHGLNTQSLEHSCCGRTCPGHQKYRTAFPKANSGIYEGGTHRIRTTPTRRLRVTAVCHTACSINCPSSVLPFSRHFWHCSSLKQPCPAPSLRHSSEPCSRRLAGCEPTVGAG